MKKLLLSSTLIATILLTVSCKNEIKDTPTQVETETVSDTKIDTTAVKKQIAQEKEALEKPYNEDEDAQEKLNELVALAKKEGKNVFVQAGGNWCIWCLRFNDFVQKNEELKNIVDQNFVYYHLNYSTKNKNKEVFDKYAPDAKNLGYPFFFVINGNGNVTNIISSGELEADKSYDINKVKQMFLDNAVK
ncbi:thioredoxin family protein [Myroides injenensis]|uniref:thioredoxin family protein n=1 Tax=Myroides injenensis TaxID=1183151 RepID=UPI000288107F|nr:thioredoxin family protein [Myroides injenensis]